ncbi:ATP-binding protein [Candidatus Woesearchaeota archaeon]|nr:ATP-binding protein [Candidatus Woesearchaeota archaeon]
MNIDKSVFSILQKNCDEHKKTPLEIIILGSLIGLFRDIFENKKEPLYSRITAKINLQQFTLQDSIETLQILDYKNIEEMFRVYILFGGFPKYYAAIEQFNLAKKDIFEIIEYLFIQENAPLETEVNDILKQEFGRRSSLYYSLLHSIAIGKTRLNEIANSLQMKESSITRHLRELEEKFSLIRSIRPIDNKKNTKYFINHHLIRFWFTYVYDKYSSYSLRDTKEIMKNIKKEYNSYLGKQFEQICKEFLVLLNTKDQLPFKVEYINNWWGHKREENERKEIEIDIIGLNQKTKQIIFIECKWKENIDPVEILTELKQKARYLHWRDNKREEYYCIIAKSFSNKIHEGNLLLIDLQEIEKELRK